MGCGRHPAIVSSAVGTSSQLRRVEVSSACFAEAGITAIHWSGGRTTYETGQEAAHQLLAKHPVDAAFCVTDVLALGFLDAVRSAGRRVPEDVSIVGFDDILQASWESYRLTTIRHPVEDLTRAVMQAVLREADPRKPMKVLVQLELIERATVRKSSSARLAEPRPRLPNRAR